MKFILGRLFRVEFLFFGKIIILKCTVLFTFWNSILVTTIVPGHWKTSLTLPIWQIALLGSTSLLNIRWMLPNRPLLLTNFRYATTIWNIHISPASSVFIWFHFRYHLLNSHNAFLEGKTLIPREYINVLFWTHYCTETLLIICRIMFNIMCD